MKTAALIPPLVTGLAAVAALLGLGWWFTQAPPWAFSERVPGMDRHFPSKGPILEQVKIGEHFESFGGVAAELAGEWPRFRGPNADNISPETLRLADRWPPTGPKLLWSVDDLGEGYAAPAVRRGRVYLLDYDEARHGDALRCFSLADGKEIWRRWYRVEVQRNHGMSRTVPAVSDRFAVTIGPLGHVMCVAPDTGNLYWELDLVRDFGAKVPLWYTGQCPLIDGDQVVLAPGGKALLMGVDGASGRVLWQTPNPHGWQMSHSSIMPMTFHGRRMYVYAAVGGVVGVSADAADRGKRLWETAAFNHAVVVPSPLVLPDGRIFLTAGYNAGGMMIEVTESAGVFGVRVLQTTTPATGLASEQQTPLLYQGHLFAILPKDAEGLRNQFVCCTPDDCSKFVWTSGKTNRFGLGPYIVADGKFYILADDGVLSMVRASTAGYEPLAHAKVLKGPDAWGPIAVVGGRMLLRDTKRMVCIDVKGEYD